MYASTRLSVFAGLLTLVGLGLCATRPEAIAALGGQVTGMRDPEEAVQQEEQTGRELDQRSRAVRQRMVERTRIVHDLIDGKLTLHQAADRFHTLNCEAPDCQTAFQWAFPGKSDEERCCRQVIAWTHALLVRESPVRAAMVTLPLRAELEKELHTSETVGTTR
jgi:hypothetical protein